MTQVCDTCHAFKVFGNKCWFHWEGKKACSQYKKTETEPPRYESVE